MIEDRPKNGSGTPTWSKCRHGGATARYPGRLVRLYVFATGVHSTAFVYPGTHTALRQPCASAAFQQLELRSCASDKRRFVGRRLGGRAVDKLAANTPAQKYLWASCLWAGLTRGDVWAADDILSEDNPDVVVVKKHTKGTILGPSKLDPLERLAVSWEHRADGRVGRLVVSTKPLDLTSQEPPLPGGFTRGDVVWALGDVYLTERLAATSLP